MSRSQAAGHVLENPDPVLHEPEKPGIPGQPDAVRDATAQDDRAQRQHDQAHVVSAADPQSNIEGHRRVAHVPRSSGGHGRVHGDAYQTRGRVGKRVGETVAQSEGVLAMTLDYSQDTGNVAHVLTIL